MNRASQRGKAVAMTIVRGTGKKQAMLKTLRDIAHDLSELARDRIARAPGWGRMMSLVED